MNASYGKLLIGFGVSGLVLFALSQAAGSNKREAPKGPPIAERTIEVTGVVTYRVAKLGDGFFRIRAYAPGTEKLGTDNEIAEMVFGPQGPTFFWGDGATIERMRTDMQRFPTDLFASSDEPKSLT
jgi:hypothetical protein